VDQMPTDFAFINELMAESFPLAELVKGLSPEDVTVCQCVESCDDVCMNRKDRSMCTVSNCRFGAASCGNSGPIVLSHEKRSHVMVKRCGFKGFGLFLRQSAFVKQFMFVYMGEVFDPSSSKAEERFKASSYIMVGGRKGDKLRPAFGVDARLFGDTSRFVNHSCRPNASIEDWRIGSRQLLFFRALKFILPLVEEVTIDYNWSKEALGGECLCGELYDCKYNPRVVQESDRLEPLTPYQAEIVRVFRTKFAGVNALKQGLISNCDTEIHKFSQLTENKWLGSAIINDFFSILQKRDVKHSEFTDTRPSLFGLTYFMAALCDPWIPTKHYDFAGAKRFLDMKSYLKDRRIFNKRRVFFPTNILKPVPSRRGNATLDGWHWVLLIADIQARMIYYGDPACGMMTRTSNPRMYANTFTQSLLKYLGDQYDFELANGLIADADIRERPSAETWGIRIFSKDEFPQQQNGDDCGVCVSLLAERFAVDHNLSLNTSSPMTDGRNRMLLSLITGKVVY
jgi:hypothetical protein